jgi:hypothetical protein
MTRPAVFLDRDGTLVEEVPYLHDPARLVLLPGSGSTLSCTAPTTRRGRCPATPGPAAAASRARGAPGMKRPGPLRP